jgi:hypothetical protein
VGLKKLITKHNATLPSTQMPGCIYSGLVLPLIHV